MLDSEDHIPNTALPSEMRSSAERIAFPKPEVTEVTDATGAVRMLYPHPDGSYLLFRTVDEPYPVLIDETHADLTSRALTTDEASHYTTVFEPPEHPLEAQDEHFLYVVNASPIGIVDLALTMDVSPSQKEQLMTMRRRIQERTFGSQENALLDLMIASLGEKTERVDIPPDLSGFIEVAKALAGDKKSTAELHEQLEALKSAEHQHMTIEHLGSAATEHSVSIESTVSPELAKQADGIVLIRATQTEPQVLENGDVLIQSASDVTHGTQLEEGPMIPYDETDEESAQTPIFVPRETIHFSLNHQVQAHLFGSWVDSPYTIVAPLTDALVANGRPSALHGLDTFFTTGPNGTLSLPRACVIATAGDSDTVIEHTKKSIKLKSEGYDEQAIKSIVSATTEGMLPSIRSTNHYGEEESITEPNSAERWLTIEMVTASGLSLKELSAEYPDITSDLSKALSYIGERINPEQPQKAIDALVTTVLRRRLIEEAMRELGAKPEAAHEHSVGDDSFSNQIHALAKSLAVPVERHNVMPSAFAEEAAMGHLFSRASIRTRNFLPHKYINNVIRDPALEHGIKRAYVAHGLLQTARLEEPEDEAARLGAV